MLANEYGFEQRISSFMAGVYGWMGCALAITAGTAYYVASVPAIFFYIHTHAFLAVVLIMVQLGLVFAISLFINRMSFITALVLFLLYSATLGVTLSSIFYVFTEGSILSTFLTTGLMFGAMSLYGYMTKADLTSIGTMSMMVLLGLVIGMLVNLFLQSEQFNYVLSGVGVVVFVLLTAYDTQKIKEFAQPLLADREAMQKVTLLGALMLYLDFINLFLFLLQFMGARRQD